MTEWAMPDWKAKAALRKNEIAREVAEYVPDSAAVGVIANRARRLHDTGLDWNSSIELARRRANEGGWQVDVHDFDKLVAQGCSPALAARILG